jgi:hypothetical protein
MGSRSSRIVVPAVGLFVAVVAALALIAFAPLVLLPGSTDGSPLAGAPDASREVARVTAPPLRPSHGRTQPSAGEASGPQEPGAPGTAIVEAGTVVGVAGTKAGGGTVFRDGGSLGGQPAGPTVARPDPGNGNGKAKGHHKAKHHGKAKGHAKTKHHGRIAFAAPRAAKPGHLHPSRSGKHAGRSARAHARAWR